MAKSEISEVDDLAFRLYAERLSKMPANANGQEVAGWAYRKAEEFQAARELVKSGTLNVKSTSRLSDCCAPNLKPTHPHNLVSQQFAEQNGGEERVLALMKEIVAWLENHPGKNDEPAPVYVNRRSGIDWDADETKLARNVLKHYIN